MQKINIKNKRLSFLPMVLLIGCLLVLFGCDKASGQENPGKEKDSDTGGKVLKDPLRIDQKILFSQSKEGCGIFSKPDFSSKQLGHIPFNGQVVSISTSKKSKKEKGFDREHYWIFVSWTDIQGWVYGGELTETRYRAESRTFPGLGKERVFLVLHDLEDTKDDEDCGRMWLFYSAGIKEYTGDWEMYVMTDNDFRTNKGNPNYISYRSYSDFDLLILNYGNDHSKEQTYRVKRVDDKTFEFSNIKRNEVFYLREIEGERVEAFRSWGIGGGK